MKIRTEKKRNSREIRAIRLYVKGLQDRHDRYQVPRTWAQMFRAKLVQHTENSNWRKPTE